MAPTRGANLVARTTLTEEKSSGRFGASGAPTHDAFTRLLADGLAELVGSPVSRCVAGDKRADPMCCQRLTADLRKES